MSGAEICFEDILSVGDFIGKSYIECGLEAKLSDVIIKGDFFGRAVKGKAWFLPNGGKILSMKQASFCISNSSIDDFYLKMNDRYNGPTDAGETPYVLSNGGAREWYLFDAGPAQIEISRGSRENFTSVTISENPNPTPGYTKQLQLKKCAKDNRFLIGKTIQMRAETYQNGILTVSITNRSGTDCVCSGQYNLAQDRDGTGYGYMNKIRLRDHTRGRCRAFYYSKRGKEETGL